MPTYRDLRYTDAFERALLDIYVPDNMDTPPLVIWIHGGAWRMGDKENPRALPLLEHGFAVASINYRLSQEAIFPAQMHDCKAAVRWLRAHGAEYGVATKRIGVMGGSAGGHLVAMLSVTAGVAELEGDLGNPDQSSAVQAVCDWYGPSDFLRMDDRPGAMIHLTPDSPESQLIGALVTERPDLVQRASPLTYITPDAAPFLILHGSADDVVLPEQSDLLHAALLEAGVESTLVNLGGLQHGFPGEHGRWPEIWGIIVPFFKHHLILEP